MAAQRDQGPGTAAFRPIQLPAQDPVLWGPQRAEALRIKVAPFQSALLLLVARVWGGVKLKAKRHLAWQH